MVFLGVPAGGRTPARGCGGAERAQELHGTRGCSVGRDSAAQGLLAGLAFGFLPRGNESRRHCAPAAGGDAAAIRLQLAEREQALLLAQETVQVSPGAAPCASQPPPLCTVAMFARCRQPPGPPFWWQPRARAGLEVASLVSRWPTSCSQLAEQLSLSILSSWPCPASLTRARITCVNPRSPSFRASRILGGGGTLCWVWEQEYEAPNLMAARGSGEGGFPYG